MSSDQHLLIGVLALRVGLITRGQHVAALQTLAQEQRQSLGELLVQQGALRATDLELLAPLVARYQEHHVPKAEDTVVQDTLSDSGLDHKSSSSLAASSEELDGRYRIVRLHARGALGAVFVARDTELNRDVALKEIQPDKDRGDRRSRFVFEAEVTGSLEHPGIVPVYGLGYYPDGRPYYAMRFIKGDTLGEAIKRFHLSARPLSQASFAQVEFRRLLQRFIDVCQAIAYAHSRGVLHRDLKPSNIMLGKYGETLVVDWGLAKTKSSPDFDQLIDLDEAALAPASGSHIAPTIMGAAIGTPAYMSPEQAGGKLDQIGPASDVYSLGATLYHLLVGRQPNGDCDIAEILLRCQQGEIAPPRSINSAVPDALGAICMTALAHRPADRYESAQALAADIEHWLADEPVSVCAEPVSVRCRRWLRKHPGTAASLAATLIVGLLGLGSGLYFVNAEKNQTELARRAAVANEQRADDEKRIAQSVLDFVENKVFAAARPKDQDGGMGYDVQLAAALKAALHHVETSFPTQPLTEARLRMTLGTSFLYLGNAEIAEQQYLRARELYSAQLGPRSAATLTSMNLLANSYAALGRHADALKLFEETLALRQTVLGRDHPDTLVSMNTVANGYGAVGRRADALKLREETYQLMQARLGNDHPGTLAIMNNLATSYAAIGRGDDALKLREQSYALRHAKLGPDHPDTLSSRNNLAISYADAGRHYDALKLKEENLAIQKAKLGPDHPDTLRGQSNLANSYADLGRYDEAIKLEQETLALKRTKLDPGHPDTLLSMSNLASNYQDAGRYAEALQLGEETLALRQAKLGPDHPDTLGSHWGVISTHIKLKRNDEALTKIDAVLALAASAIAAGKTPHPELVAAMHTYRIGIFRDRQDSAGCRATAEMWEKLPRTDADSLYNAACFRGICAAVMGQGKEPGAAAEADRSLHWLKQAVAAGYNDIEQLKKDQDLDAVREREDFKKLKRELERKP